MVNLQRGHNVLMCFFTLLSAWRLSRGGLGGGGRTIFVEPGGAPCFRRGELRDHSATIDLPP